MEALGRVGDLSLGEPLPTVFDALEDIPAHIRLGEYLLIASGPGRGKSLMALNIVLDTQYPTLYFSPDTNVADVRKRVAAKLSGDTQNTVEEAYRYGRAGTYDELIAELVDPYVRFTWDSPTLNDINDEVLAYAMAYGDYPKIIVVDNIKNVFAHPEESESLRKTADFLKDLSHKSGAAVIGLHHLKGEWDDGLMSPPITAVRWQITKDPEQVWTLWGSGSNMNVNVVKQRGGPADPSGRTHRARLHVDYARAEIR